MVDIRELLEKHQRTAFCVVFLLLVFLLGFLYGYQMGKPKIPAPILTMPLETSKNPTAETTITVKPKENTNDPDLIVDNKYIAKINGKTVEVPTVTRETQEAGTNGAQKETRKEQVKVETVLDVSGLISKELPKWEIGTGIAIDTDGKPTVPIAIQRNYKTNKAVELMATFDTKEKAQLKEVFLLHKWKF